MEENMEFYEVVKARKTIRDFSGKKNILPAVTA